MTSRRRLAPDARTNRDALLRLRRWLDDAMGRVDFIHLREPDVEAARLVETARDLVAQSAGSGTRVLVNERADVALASGAAGVHLPASSAPTEGVRALGPAGWIVGRSAHDSSELAAAAGADYVIYGTVFPSRSKGPDAPVQGIERLAAAVASAAAPVLAIGGIDAARAAACWRAGAAGVAAIGCFLPEDRAPEGLGIAAAAAALRAAMS